MTWKSYLLLPNLLKFLSFFLSKQNSNKDNCANGKDESSDVSSCAGTVIDLTDIEGTDSTIEKGSEENVGAVSDYSDVANILLSSDFQSTPYDAAGIHLKKV